MARSPSSSPLKRTAKPCKPWDIASGALLHTYDLTPLNPPGAVKHAQYSPDGRFLAVNTYGDGATNAWVFNAQTGALLHTLAPIQIADFAFSPDSAFLLYGSYWGGGSSSVRRLLNTSDWSLARDFGNSSAVRSVAYAPNGTTLAFQTDYEGITVFNPADGSLVSTQYISSGGAKIAYTGNSAEILLPLPDSNQSAVLRYDVASGSLLTPPLLINLKYHNLQGAALSPTGDSLLLYGSDTTAYPWENAYSAVLLNAHTGAFQSLLETDNHFPGYTDPGFSLDYAAFTPDGTQALLIGNLTTSATVNDGYTARLLHLADSSPGTILLAACGVSGANCGQLRRGALSADGALAAVADNNGQLFLFHTASGALLQTLQHTRLAHPNALAFSPNGSLLALSVGGFVRIYHPASGILLHEHPASAAYVWAIAFSPDSSLLALADSADTLTILNTADWSLNRQQTNLHGGSIFSVAYTADGSRLLTGGYDGRAKLWNAQTGDLLLQTTGDTSAAVSWAALDPTQTSLYTASAFDYTFGYTWGSFDHRLHRWNLAQALPAGREPIIPIQPDNVYTATVTANLWADFSLAADSAQPGLVITATLPLYARWNAQPTHGLADFRATTPAPNGVYTLVIPQPRPETLFIGATGAPAAPVHLRATYPSRALAQSAPAQAGNAGQTTLTLGGLGFEETMQVGLCQSAAIQHPAAALEILNPQTAAARFDLAGAEVGLYDLCISWSDSFTATLPGALTVTAGGGAALHAELSVPAQHRPNRPYTALLTYQNTGDSDLPAPLFLLHNSANAPAQTPCNTGWYTGTLQLFGSSAPLGLAGTLTPGAQGQIPIRFIGSEDPDHTLVNFTVEALLPNDQPIDWNAYRDVMRPPAIPVDEWQALFPALTAQLGSTWADYLTVLSHNATRLGLRGAPTVCVPDLLALEVDKARGLPTAAISGVALHAQSGQPLRGVKIAAYFHNPADELTFRAETTALLDGSFILDGLPEGAYHLALEGYSLSSTAPLTLTNDGDVNHLLLYAAPLVESAETPETAPAAPGFDPALAVNGSGQAALAWQQGSGLWAAHYDPAADRWLNAAPLPDVQGNSPALAYGATIANGSPGFTLLWREGYGNQGRLYYAVAAAPSDTGFLWSAPITLTQDSFGDSAPAVSVLPDGSPLMVYLQRDWGVEDDFDLYYANPAVPLNLVFTLADEAGQHYQLRLPFSPDVEACAAITLKQGTALPKWVPVIGGNYKFEVAGESCATLGCSLGGAVSGKVDVEFTKYAAGSGSLSGSAGWETDPKSCTYVFDKANVTLTAAAEGKIPVGKFTVLGVDVEAGAAVNGSLSGSLGWKGGTLTRLPDSGEVNLTAGLGPYGKAEIWGVEAEVKGTGSAGLKYSVPKTLEFSGFCLNFSGSAKFRIVTLSFTKSVGDDCGGLLAAAAPALPASAQTRTTCVTVIRDGLPVRDCKTESVQAQQGTGNTYPGAPVLPNLSADLTHDGAARLVSTAGLPLLNGGTLAAAETLAVWTKDSPSPTMTVGSALVAAAFDGADWGAPVVIADSADFNSDPALTYLADGQPLVVWTRAAAAGLSLSSTITEVVTALEATEIYYSLRTGGVWSAPALLAGAAGSDLKPQAAADGQGGALAAWVNTADTANSALQTAFWNGASWDAPLTLETPAGVVDSLAVSYIVSGTQTVPLLVWAQTTNSDDANRDDLMLFYARYVDGAWCAARPVAAQTGEPPALARAVEVPALRLPTQYGPAAPEWVPPAPPASCCQPKAETNPIPPQPPSDDPVTPAPEGTQPVASAVSELIRPRDPNEKAGLPGVGSLHQVLPDTRLAYVIFFENVMTATAPAQVVVVSDTLDSRLDWGSVRFEGFGFGAVSEAVGENTATFERVMAIRDYRAEREQIWFVQVRGEMDAQTGLLLWTFTTLDPATNDLPEDALAGFLPPNDERGRGQGYVAFSVAPQSALPPGTLIRNRAEIVFDSETSILTNWYANVLDWFKVYLPLVRR